MVIEAAKQAAEDFCKAMNRQLYKDDTGNIRNSYGYVIKDDKIVIVRGMDVLGTVDIPIPIEP